MATIPGQTAVNPLDLAAPLMVTGPEGQGAGQPQAPPPPQKVDISRLPIGQAPTPGGSWQQLPPDPSQPVYQPTVRYDRSAEASPGPAVEGGTIPAMGNATPPSGAGAPAYVAHEEAMIQDHMGALRDLAVAKLAQGDYAGSKAASEAFTAMGTQLMAAKQFQQTQQVLSSQAGGTLPEGQSLSLPMAGGAKLNLAGGAATSPAGLARAALREPPSQANPTGLGREPSGGEIAAEVQRRAIETATAMGAGRAQGYGNIRLKTYINTETGMPEDVSSTKYQQAMIDTPGKYVPFSAAMQTGTAPGELISKAGTIQAMRGGLQQLEKQRALVETFMNTAGKNLALVGQLSDAVERTDVPLLNKLLIPFKVQIQGDTDTAGLQMALRVAVDEATKILGSASANGIVSEQERSRIDASINAAQTPAQLRKVIEVLSYDINSRKTSYDAQRATIQQQLGALGTGGQQPQVDLTKPQSKLPPGWRVKQ